VPSDPVDAIVAAFDQRSLVALAEAHGLQEEHDLIVRLVRDRASPPPLPRQQICLLP
jgi:hypothetical protein